MYNRAAEGFGLGCSHKKIAKIFDVLVVEKTVYEICCKRFRWIRICYSTLDTLSSHLVELFASRLASFS